MTPEFFTTVIQGYLPEPHASILNGILFGVRLQTSGEFYSELRRTGLLHIVVLSGMNITMLGAFLSILFERFGRKIASLLSIAGIVLFILFVGPEAPVVRAGCMGVLTIVAIVFGRKAISLYLLIISAVIIGIFWTEWLTSVSFQLSFSATLGLILFAPKTGQPQGGSLVQTRHYIGQQLRITLAAQVFTAPIIFIYFKQISLISPIANVLVAPFIAPLMIFGFAAAILGKIHSLLGLIPALICQGMLSFVVGVVNILSQLQYASIDF